MLGSIKSITAQCFLAKLHMYTHLDNHNHIRFLFSLPKLKLNNFPRFGILQITALVAQVDRAAVS